MPSSSNYNPGQRLGKLILIKEVDPHICPSGQIKRKALFKCDCGTEIEALVDNVKREKIVSCGCKKVKRIKAMSITHGLTNHRLHSVWKNMKTRCTNPKTWNYENYGGRGIMICDEWRNNFKAFYDWAIANGYQEDLQIDRIDNDGNYEPNNCRWVTAKANANNRIRKAI